MNWKDASPEERFAEAERRIEDAQRTKATSLDLGDLGLAELPESLGNLQHLEELLLGKSYRNLGGIGWASDRHESIFTALGPVTRLTQIRSLFLGPNQSLSEALESLAQLDQLQNLELYDCPNFTGNLQPLAQLKQLQNLELYNFPSLTGDLQPLAKLDQLWNLQLSSCDGLTGDLQPLAHLDQLRYLEISSCDGLTGDLQPLAKLNQLEYLEISSCDGLTGDLQPLAKLNQLEYLELSSYDGFTGDLQPLAKLNQLQKLNLSSVGLTGDLQPLAKLHQLQRLRLFFCEGLTGDLQPLAKLHELQKLNLSSCEGLTGDLQPLAKLHQLQKLELSYCEGLTGNLQPLTQLGQLQNLELSHCNGLTGGLECISETPRLESLVIWSCALILINLEVALESFRSSTRLWSLTCDYITNIPAEVLSKSIADNCLPRVRAFLNDLEAGEAQESDIKTILLGNGRVGKTQLCQRLRGESYEESSPSTHGVQLYRQQLTLQHQGQDSTYCINWWDFGGQDIYHSTHSLFLRSRAVFLVLWTPQLENNDELEENGVPMRNQPLAYWLDYVHSLAGPDSPVIVVQSQCETFAQEQKPPLAPDQFAFSRICSFSAKTEHGKEALETHLRDAIRFLREKAGEVLIGSGRARLRDRLYAMRDAETSLEPEQRQHRTLSLEEFEKLCADVGGISSPLHLLDYLHQTGVVFHQKGLFDGRIVLDQSWALEAVYSVFNRARTMPALREHGRFTRRDLATLCWEDKSEEEQRLLLDLMVSCGICFVYEQAWKDREPTYIAPDLLPSYDDVKKQLFAWHEGEEDYLLFLEYKFLHQALLRSLISQIGATVRENAVYWKYGLWLRTREGTQLCVRQESTSTANAPAAGALSIGAQGPESKKLLQEVCKLISRSSYLEKPTELLRIGSTVVARSAIDSRIGGKVLATDGREVDARPYTDFWMDRREADPGATESAAEFKIDPAPLPSVEVAAVEVYISYAWGDDTAEGKIRGEVVERLSQALRNDNFEVHRDRDDLRRGDLISRFMQKLVHGKAVVAIISDRYLRSPFCMYEIYKLYQACQAEPETLARRVVPIVLPDVRLGSLKDRAPYLRYWSQQEREIKDLMADPDIRPSAQSFEEFRLVRDFANHIDNILIFLQDVLMPRNLDAHFDGDFEAIRETLRRVASPKS